MSAMISWNIEELIDSFKQIIVETETKLRSMVMYFSYDILNGVIRNTPLGDAEKFDAFYTSRRGTGLPEYEGLSRYNWQYSKLSWAPLKTDFSLGSDVGAQALSNFKESFKQFQLGETFYITNSTPYIRRLERNHSPQTNGVGIMKPTVDDITQIYQNNLLNYFNRT